MRKFRFMVMLILISGAGYFLLCLKLHSYIKAKEHNSILNPNCNGKKNTRVASKAKKFLSEKALNDRLENCETYFDTIPVEAIRQKSRENIDLEFQFAFSHQVHKEIGILEIFLALIFRPHNIHCLHVDIKTPKETQKTIESLVKCYQNQFGNDSIFIVDNPVSVTWAHVSVLQADILCLESLLERKSTWSYFINTAGTELPIVPYSVFEEKAKQAKNSNIVESYKLPADFKHRIKFQYKLEQNEKGSSVLTKTNLTKTFPPPFNLTIYKGMRYGILTRSFSHFLIKDPVAIEFYNWLQDVNVADEFFVPTLVRVVQSNADHVVQDHDMVFSDTLLPRYALWKINDEQICNGKWIRFVCNLSVSDLISMRQSRCLIGNKFNLEVDPRAPICQWKYVRDLADLRIENSTVIK